MSSFKEDHSFEDRYEECQRILKKYPDRIPVIVDKHSGSDIPDIDKHKFLIPSDLTVGQFIYVIRKRIQLNPEQAIFVFVNGRLPPTTSLMSQIYEEHVERYMENAKEEQVDGFLYISYSGENTFG